MRKILTKNILRDMVQDYHNGIGLVELSKKYGFQEQTIQKHFHVINIEITKGKSIKFSKQELKNIIYDYQNGIMVSNLLKNIIEILELLLKNYRILEFINL